MKMESTENKGLTGGFTTERCFGFEIPTLFPNIDTKPVDLDGAALIVTIDNPRTLNIYQLSRVISGAARGGVKSAVVVFKNAPIPKAMPIFNLWLMVDAMESLKGELKLEHTIRTGV